MDDLFLSHNIQRQSPAQFSELDSDLKLFKQFPLVYESPLLNQFPIDTAGIMTLTGGGLTGKTTLLKQWVLRLLKQGVAGDAITFYPVKNLKNTNELLLSLQTQFSDEPPTSLKYIIFDDITHIREWEKIIKLIADKGWLARALFMIADSDQRIAKTIEKLAVRQPATNTFYFYIYPLSFRETVLLKQQNSFSGEINLYEEFNDYLLHGGYLIAINDIAIHREILESSLKRYSDWLIKEVVKSGRHENFLREVLTGILNHYNNQITWNRLAQELSIDHPKTIGDYVTLLEASDVIFVQSALLEATLQPAPKKARKLMFTDPFIYHAIRCWLYPNKNCFEFEKKLILNNSELTSKLVEACVTTHFSRFYPTYYIKAEGEVDLAYIYDQRFWPIVVVWSNQFQAKELKQIMKYPNGKILTKIQRSGIIEKIRTEPVPQALWKLEG